MDIRKTFLGLTKYTTPYGTEDTLRKYLPKDARKDGIGNWYVKIGESDSIFAAHLDTVSNQLIRIKHVFRNNDIVGTDGSTTLGADDKAGVTILLYMIANKVPGLYYFFIGEEVGTIGSSGAADRYGNRFKKFKRIISFDRRGKGSIINRQLAQKCCSDAFVDALAAQFAKSGMRHFMDGTGIYTDSARFMNLISEVTNISVGYRGEHTGGEVQDLAYLEKLCEARVKVDWESLPTERTPGGKDDLEPYMYGGAGPVYDTDDGMLFMRVRDFFWSLDRECINQDDFRPGREMVFNPWREGDTIFVKVKEGNIIVNDKTYDNYREFVMDNLPEGEELTLNMIIDPNEFYDDLDEYLDIKYGETYNIKAIVVHRLLEKHKADITQLVTWLHRKGGEIWGLSWDDEKQEFIYKPTDPNEAMNTPPSGYVEIEHDDQFPDDDWEEEEEEDDWTGNKTPPF